MSNGWDAHLERHAAIGAVFDTAAWEQLAAAIEQDQAVVRTTVALLAAQLEALRGAIAEQEAQMLAVLDALGQVAAPSDLGSGPPAVPTGWDDGVHDFQQHLVAANAAADEVRFRAGLQPQLPAAARGADAADDRMYAEGWHRACAVYEALATGAALPSLRAPAAPVEPGEAVYVDEWMVSGSFPVIYDADLRELLRQAISVDPGDVTAPRWGSCRVVLTDRRTLYQIDDTWRAHPHIDGVDIASDVTRAGVIVWPRESVRLLLRGPGAPAFAVMLATLVHGVKGLGLAGFAPLVMAAAGRRRGVSGSGGAA